MTKDKKAKQAARDYAATHGIPYTAARRALSGNGGKGGEPPTSGDDFNPWDDYPERRSVDELAKDAAMGECANRAGGDIDVTPDRSGSGPVATLELPDGIDRTLIGQIELDELSVDVQVEEEHEGGTLTCTVTAAATLTVEALMAKVDAHVAAEAGQVSLVDEDFNDHYAEVVSEHEVELTFEAIITPDTESVELMELTDFSQIGSGVIGS
jgi:hypothetical protein